MGSNLHRHMVGFAKDSCQKVLGCWQPIQSSFISCMKYKKLAQKSAASCWIWTIETPEPTKTNHFWTHNRSPPSFPCPFSPFSTMMLERFSVAATAKTETLMEHLELRDDECPAMFPTESTRWFRYPLHMESDFWVLIYRLSFLHDFLPLEDPGALNLRFV